MCGSRHPTEWTFSKENFRDFVRRWGNLNFSFGIKSIKYLLTETGKLHTFGFTLSISFFFLRIQKLQYTVDLHVMHLLDHLRDGAKVVSMDGNVFSASAKFYSTETHPKK